MFRLRYGSCTLQDIHGHLQSVAKSKRQARLAIASLANADERAKFFRLNWTALIHPAVAQHCRLAKPTHASVQLRFGGECWRSPLQKHDANLPSHPGKSPQPHRKPALISKSLAMVVATAKSDSETPDPNTDTSPNTISSLALPAMMIARMSLHICSVGKRSW